MLKKVPKKEFDENIDEGITCAARLVEYNAPIQELMSTVIGRTLVNLDGERDHVRTQETNLSDLIADAMLVSSLVNTFNLKGALSNHQAPVFG